ncbi:MAG TPA: hypothetical protein VNR00_19860 [Opitutus sp.]|nr:hypothetical protein [Opitutus sp.]
MKIVVIGLSITSSWGNGHATTYRGLLREFAQRGHEVLFLERDVPWYADNRDLHELVGVDIHLYSTLDELRRTYRDAVHDANAVVVGSYVQDRIAAVSSSPARNFRRTSRSRRTSPASSISRPPGTNASTTSSGSR